MDKAFAFQLVKQNAYKELMLLWWNSDQQFCGKSKIETGKFAGKQCQLEFAKWHVMTFQIPKSWSNHFLIKIT